jgi:hypothetical protein
MGGRKGVCAGIFVLAMAGSAGSAQAAVTIGHGLASGPSGTVSCNVACTLDNGATATVNLASGGLSSPVGGVVVRYRFLVNAAVQPGPATIVPRVLREQSGAGSGSPVTLADTDGIQEFATRLPIAAGDQIGFDLSENTPIGIARAHTGSRVRVWRPPLADGESPRDPSPVFTDRELTFNADIEADRDGDGFGDETQDGCPTQAAVTTGSCVPPNTTITKTKKVGKRGARVFFTSSDPAAVFNCRLDHRGAKPCTSPVEYRGLSRGNHRVFVYAYNGTFDPTPAVTKVKVE